MMLSAALEGVGVGTPSTGLADAPGASTTQRDEVARGHVLFTWAREPVKIDGLNAVSMPPDFGFRASGIAGVLEVESDWTTVGTPFHEALVSFNIDVPAASGIIVEMRVARERSGASALVSPWLRVARWGEVTPSGALGEGAPGVRAFGDPTGLSGKIDVDEFRSAHLWERVQWRVRAFGPGAARVRIEHVSVCVSTMTRWWEKPLDRTQAQAMEMAVPFRSQKTPDPSLSGRLCSPTSVSMVLARLGLECGENAVRDRALDPDEQIFGNWPRNVQAAYELGASGMLVRIDSMQQAERMLRAGTPLVASISVKCAGELTGAPYRTTTGHLIVLRGIDANGDVLVNDPAAADARAGMLTYKRNELRKVWLENGRGTAYVFFKRSNREEAREPTPTGAGTRR
jgi:hypothetical protein